MSEECCWALGWDVQRLNAQQSDRSIQRGRAMTNSCARCKAVVRVLADRALWRLLKSDFPQTIEELAD